MSLSSSSKKPIGADMTMDEILSSIRQIISHDTPKKTNSHHVTNRETNIQTPFTSQQELKDLDQRSDLEHFESNSQTESISKTFDNIRNSLEENRLSSIKKEEKINSPYHDVQKDINDARNILQRNHKEPLRDTIEIRHAQEDVPSFLKKLTDKPPQKKETINSVNGYEESKRESIIELTDKIIPDHSSENNTRSLKQKIDVAKKENSSYNHLKTDPPVSDGIEKIIIKSMQPFVKQWVEENIEEIAQKVIREELSRHGLKL